MARMGDRSGGYRVLVGRLEGKRPLQELGVEERTILKWMFKNWVDETWIGLLCPRIGTGGGRLCMR